MVSEPGIAELQPRQGRLDANNRHKTQRYEPQQDVLTHQNICAAANQRCQQEHPQNTGIGPKAYALYVEDAAGHQVASVHPVVPGETQTLKLAVKVQAKLVADSLADRLAQIVLQHGKDATQARSA